MVTANDIYKQYVDAGGLAGISEKILDFLRTSWRTHDYVLSLFQQCVEIYRQAFPRGRPPRNPDEAIRRQVIFAAVLGRLRRLRSPRAKEIEKLYEKYRRIIIKIIRYRDAWEALTKLRPDYLSIVDILNKAKTIKENEQRAKMIFDSITKFYESCKKARDICRDFGIKPLLDFFTKNCSLGNLWFEFTYALTCETGDEYWMYRTLEIHVTTSTHAELVFDPITDEKLSEIVISILDMSGNSWLLSFSQLRGFPFEYESKQLLSYRKGRLPKTVRFRMILYDHNYGFNRIDAYGRISSNWQLLDDSEILDQIRKTGGIDIFEVRGVRGRLKETGGRSYRFKVKKIGDREFIVLDKIIEEGVEKNIEDLLFKKEEKKKEGEEEKK